MKEFFEVLETQLVVIVRKDLKLCEAVVKMRVGEKIYMDAEHGQGTIEAIDKAFRKILEVVYPDLVRVKFTRFDAKDAGNINEAGAAVKARVIFGMKYNGEELVFAGESPNIVDAACLALEKGYNACLRGLLTKKKTVAAETPAGSGEDMDPEKKEELREYYESLYNFDHIDKKPRKKRQKRAKNQ